MDVVVEFSEFDPCAVLEVVIAAALELSHCHGKALARRLSYEHLSPRPPQDRNMKLIDVCKEAHP
jgi:hypothetical protein